MRARLVAGLGVLALCACAHPPGARGLQGTWEVASLRARLGPQLVELAQEETSAEGIDGKAHRYSAGGTLLLARDGSCRLLLDVRVDGAAPGRSERACTWRSEGARLTLEDPGGAVTVYRVGQQSGGLLLEALVLSGSPDDDEWTTGEQMVLVPAPTAPALAALPEPDGAAGTLEK